MSLARALRIRADAEERAASVAATRVDAALAVRTCNLLRELADDLDGASARLVRMAERLGCPEGMGEAVKREIGGEDSNTERKGDQ